MTKYQTVIAGLRVDSASGEFFETDNPYTGRPWALIPRCGVEDVDRAVRAAHRWRRSAIRSARRMFWVHTPAARP